MIVLRPAAALTTAVLRNLLWNLTASFASGRCGCDCRHETKNVAFATRDEGHLRLTEPSCALGKRVENGLKVEGRTTYQLEYVRGRGLLPQRFGEIGCALAQFVKQPRVLDGDDVLG